MGPMRWWLEGKIDWLGLLTDITTFIKIKIKINMPWRQWIEHFIKVWTWLCYQMFRLHIILFLSTYQNNTDPNHGHIMIV
jgi:hypothetical protein